MRKRGSARNGNIGSKEKVKRDPPTANRKNDIQY